MTSISHALIGASIAAKIHNPAAAAGISLITHFLCDTIPHWDLGTNWRLRPKLVTGILAIGETLIAIFGTFFIFSGTIAPLTLAIAIIFSLIPDWIEAPYFFLIPTPRFFYYVYKVQSTVHEKLQAPWGIVTQIAVVGLFMSLDLYFSGKVNSG